MSKYIQSLSTSWFFRFSTELTLRWEIDPWWIYTFLSFLKGLGDETYHFWIIIHVIVVFILPKKNTELKGTPVFFIYDTVPHSLYGHSRTTVHTHPPERVKLIFPPGPHDYRFDCLCVHSPYHIFEVTECPVILSEEISRFLDQSHVRSTSFKKFLLKFLYRQRKKGVSTKKNLKRLALDSSVLSQCTVSQVELLSLRRRQTGLCSSRQTEWLI